MPLFEVAILEKPKKKAEDQTERLVLEPTFVVASDEQAAAISVVMDSKKLEVDRSRMEVLVRPFG